MIKAGKNCGEKGKDIQGRFMININVLKLLMKLTRFISIKLRKNIRI